MPRFSGGGGGGSSRGSSSKSKKEEPKKKKSLFSRAVSLVGRGAKDVGRLATGIPGGLANAAEALIEVPEGAAAAIQVSAKHGHVPFTKYKSKEQETAINEELHKKVPHLFGLAVAPAQTVRNLGGKSLLSADTKERFTQDTGKLYSEHPIAALVGDVATLSPAFRAAGAVAEGTAASRFLAPVNKAAETINNIPLAPAKAVGKLARKAYKVADESEGRLGSALRGAKLDTQSRAVEKVRQKAQAIEGAETARVARGLKKLVKVTKDADEQDAASLAMQGENIAMSTLRSTVPEEQFNQWVDREFKGTVSPKAANLAVDLWEQQRRGSLNETSKRIQKFIDEGVPQRAERTAGYLERGGRTRQENLGKEPLSIGVAEAEAKATKKVERAQRFAEKAELSAARTEQSLSGRLATEPKLESLFNQSKVAARRVSEAAAQRDKIAARLKNSVSELEKKSTQRAFEKADAHYRRMVEAQTKLDDRLARTSVPTARAAEAGKRAGETVGDAKARIRAKQAVVAREARRVERAKAAVKTAVSLAKHDVDNAPARLRPTLERARSAQAEIGKNVADLINQGRLNEAEALAKVASTLPTTLKQMDDAGLNFDHLYRVKLEEPTALGRTNTKLPTTGKSSEQRFRKGATALDRSALAQAKRELNDVHKFVQKQAADEIKAIPGLTKQFDSVLEAERAGYRLFDPKNSQNHNTITEGSVFLPKHVIENFTNWFKEPTSNTFLKGYDATTQAFRISVLGLNPGWNVGNVIANSLMATVGAGVNPARLALEVGRNLREFKRTGEFAGPDRLFSAGPAFEDLNLLKGGVLDQPTTRFGKIVKAAKAPARASFKANEFVDDLMRSSVFKAKVGKVGAERAITETLNAMGDFSRFTPFERSVVRRIIPFYAWQRHITQLALRLPIEHPVRTAWMLHLADVAQKGDPDGDLFGVFGQGSVRIPGTDLRVGGNSMNPFSNFGTTLNPLRLPQSLHPLLKVGGQSLLNVNFYTGKPFKRPRDEEGNPVVAAPSILKQITDISPQKRLWESISSRGKWVRYENGDRVIIGGKPVPSDRTMTQAIANFLGVPFYRGEQVRAALQRKQEKEAGTQKTSSRSGTSSRRLFR